VVALTTLLIAVQSENTSPSRIGQSRNYDYVIDIHPDDANCEPYGVTNVVRAGSPSLFVILAILSHISEPRAP